MKAKPNLNFAHHKWNIGHECSWLAHRTQNNLLNVCKWSAMGDVWFIQCDCELLCAFVVGLWALVLCMFTVLLTVGVCNFLGHGLWLCIVPRVLSLLRVPNAVDSLEIEQKYTEIMKQNGILTINDQVGALGLYITLCCKAFEACCAIKSLV